MAVMLICMALPASAWGYGNVVSTAYHTDIVAYINHYAIPSFAINGTSCIVAEDLRNFGFDVIWNGDARTLSIYRNSTNSVSGMNFSKERPGTKFADVVKSDIGVYAGDRWVTSYAINGYTLIPIEELTMFGACYWVEAERAIKLWIDNLPICDPQQEVPGYKIYSQIPREFVFTSGAGAWSTGITINPDGTFTGQFHDSDMGDRGAGYPNGTMYISNFSGAFSAAEKLDNYRYKVTLSYLVQHDRQGDVYFQNGQRLIVSYPYGFDDAHEFIIYLPGTPISLVEDEFLFWAFLNGQNIRYLPNTLYGLYNVGGQLGFYSSTEWDCW